MSGGVHDVAARGFDAAPEVYERARPGYPADAVAFMADVMRLRDASLVVDLAAGTGKFTKELVARSIPCIAVEPVDGMRRTLREVLPGVAVVGGTAEAIPVRDASANAITVAQAFHWFATDAAVTELARVLAPGGTLGLVWNARDDSVDWVRRITEIFARYEHADGIRVPRHRERAWRGPLVRSPLFRPVAEREFPNAQTLTRDGLVERVLSVSFIAVLPDDEKERAVGRLRSVIETHPDLVERETIEHPYVTEVYVFERV